MKKFFAKRLKNEKGLTLIELLAVIVILAIIAAIAVPAIGNIIDNSKDSSKLAAASNILAGAKIAATDGACEESNDGSITCDKDDLKGYVENVKEEKGTTLNYGADKDTDGNWTVTYNGLTNFNSKKYKDESIASPLAESKLNELLSK
ncbi:prepilin-type N-terminal cleavage/methylation domain-containing protein [Sporosarcina oncorhynchi]|uniref:Prepilin-type N-terminal cleavage/methylation domain-containing protein n=1 Tax=Sporosarcina oncorhynchi TaxID=3056444 RepID=A0ABZ0L848_9BACL|nr:prepilin-type N-terminal cleavage/methylation domain-containing protein [Sporosarcina sp. T2O-4]WOV88726.1 prepilin-type N-terminal cleavage/methylation domain-containing protein [Sporosarcina sp. T2O-4]